MLIGDKKDKGNAFGTSLIAASDSLHNNRSLERDPLRNICILKGGIDAVKVEHPELLAGKSSKGGGASSSEQAMIETFAKYVQKHNHGSA